MSPGNRSVPSLTRSQYAVRQQWTPLIMLSEQLRPSAYSAQRHTIQYYCILVSAVISRFHRGTIKLENIEASTILIFALEGVVLLCVYLFALFLEFYIVFIFLCLPFQDII